MKRFFISFFGVLSLLVLVSCGTTPVSETGSADLEMISEPENQSPFYLKMMSILEMINGDDLEEAEIILLESKPEITTIDESVLYHYTHARLLLAHQDTTGARAVLESPQFEERILEASAYLQASVGLLKAEILEQQENYALAAQQRIYIAPMIEDQNRYLKNHEKIWQDMGKLTADDITYILKQYEDGDFRQWALLSQAVQHSEMVLDKQIKNIDAWQAEYPIHPAAMIPPPEVAVIRQAAMNRANNIAIILPFDSKYKPYATAIRDGFMRSYLESTHQPKLVFYSNDELQPFMDIYQLAVEEGAELVIGPLFKSQLEELYTLEALPVTTIALNRLNRDDKPKGLFELSMASEDEIDSLIYAARKNRHFNAAIIAQDENWARENVDYFSEHWQATGNRIFNTVYAGKARQQSKDIQELLNIDHSKQRMRELQWALGITVEHEPRRRKDLDMIMMFAKPDVASSLKPLLAFHYAKYLPVYATSQVYRGYPDPDKDADLSGIRFTDLPLLINQSDSIIDKYSATPLVRMYAFGIDAFKLGERINLMEAMPSLPVNGATGLITLQENKLDRDLPMAMFRRGRIEPIPSLSTQ